MLKIIRKTNWFLDGDDWDCEVYWVVINEGAGEVFHCPYDWGEKHCKDFIKEVHRDRS